MVVALSSCSVCSSDCDAHNQRVTEAIDALLGDEILRVGEALDQAVSEFSFAWRDMLVGSPTHWQFLRAW